MITMYRVVRISDIDYVLHRTIQEMTRYKLERKRVTRRYYFKVYIFENFLQ